MISQIFELIKCYLCYTKFHFTSLVTEKQNETRVHGDKRSRALCLK